MAGIVSKYITSKTTESEVEKQDEEVANTNDDDHHHHHHHLHRTENSLPRYRQKRPSAQRENPASTHAGRSDRSVRGRGNGLQAPRPHGVSSAVETGDLGEGEEGGFGGISVASTLRAFLPPSLLSTKRLTFNLKKKYKTASVRKSLRLRAATTSRLPLVSDKELVYGKWVIPANVSRTNPHYPPSFSSRTTLTLTVTLYATDRSQHEPPRHPPQRDHLREGYLDVYRDGVRHPT